MMGFDDFFGCDFEYFKALRPGLAKCRDLKMFLSIFGKELFKSCEFSFRNALESPLELAAESSDDYFFSRAVHFLEFIGTPSESISRLQKAYYALDSGDAIIKAGFSEDGCVSASVYFKRPCRSFELEAMTGGCMSSKSLDEYSERFGNVFFFAGVDLMPFRVVPYIIQRNRLERTVPALMHFAGMEGNSAFAEDVSILNMITKGDVFISFLPSEGKIKADFIGIPAPAAFKAVKDLGIPFEGFRTAVEFLMRTGEKNFYYFSLSSIKGSLSAKYYFKRFYESGGDAALRIANHLEKIQILR